MRIAAETTDHAPVEVAAAINALSTLSDAELLDAWKCDRHGPSLAVLVQRYRVMVLSVCRRRCRSEADADDAFQSTFLYLADNARKIRHPERLPGWLQRVAQRAAMATLKTASRESEPMVEPPVNPEDPLDRLAQRHEAIVLDEELADLPEHYRSAIVLHLFEGRSIQGLADHFGTSVGSIRGRLQRGKQLLAQRLRHRGVVPVLAFAAAEAWRVTPTQAAEISDPFIESIAVGEPPDAPIDAPLLESLLVQGVRLMPSLYTVAGLAGGTALVAFLMTTNGSLGQTSSSGQSDRQESVETMTFSSEVAGQFGGMGGIAGGESVAITDGKNTNGALNAAAGGSGPTPANQEMVWSQKPVPAVADSDTAVMANAALDQDIDFEVSVLLAGLPVLLEDVLNVPVMLDSRGIEFARQDITKTKVSNEGGSTPARTVLRRMLEPLGLKAIVENEGVVITADPAALVHQGIGTDRWINIDEAAEKKIADALEQRMDAEFRELPLQDVMQGLAQQQGIPIIVDHRSLEEVGLSGDEPVTIAIGDCKLRSLLDLMLQDLDLTYTVQGESLVITTEEYTDYSQLNRIYWLEGTGYASGDYQSIIDSITTSIAPDSWEAMGGPSTIVPLGSSRPALMIRASYRVHHQLENLFKTLRESHFGMDPVLEQVQIPAPDLSGGLGQSGGFF